MTISISNPNQRCQTVNAVAMTLMLVGGSISCAGFQGFIWKDRSHAVTGAEGSCQGVPT